LGAIWADLSDTEIWSLGRGANVHERAYIAYAAALRRCGKPTVVLAKTVKGFGMGEAGEGPNVNHQLKKMNADAVRAIRARFALDLPDERLDEMPYLKPAPGSEDERYLQARRAVLGGHVPARQDTAAPPAVPPLE